MRVCCRTVYLRINVVEKALFGGGAGIQQYLIGSKLLFE